MSAGSSFGCANFEGSSVADGAQDMSSVFSDPHSNFICRQVEQGEEQCFSSFTAWSDWWGLVTSCSGLSFLWVQNDWDPIGKRSCWPSGYVFVEVVRQAMIFFWACSVCELCKACIWLLRHYVFHRRSIFVLPPVAFCLYAAGFSFCCGAVPLLWLESIPEVDDNAWGIDFMIWCWRIALFSFCVTLTCLILRRRLEGQYPEPIQARRCGSRRTKSVRCRSVRIRWIGVFLLCNVIHAHAIHSIEGFQYCDEPGNQELDEAYQSTIRSVDEDPASWPCGQGFSECLFDDGNEGFAEVSLTPAAPALGRRAHFCHAGFVPHFVGDWFAADGHPFGGGDFGEVESGFCPTFSSDAVSLMQTSSTASAFDPLLLHAWGVSADLPIRVLVWLHTWDRRGQWAFVGRFIDVWPRVAVRHQIVQGLRDFQVRPTLKVFRVRCTLRQQPREVPNFLALTVDAEEWVGLLVRAETPWQTQLGTYLLRAATFPLVSAIFMQMLPMNQCIWMTQCWIEAEGRSFQWFSTIPLYEGMFLQLHEILEQESEASTVCDSGSDDYSSHESNSNATESDNGVLLQVGWTESVARGNTATLSKQTPLTESPETPMLYEIKQQENTATCMGAQGDAFSRSKDGLCAALLDEHDGDTVGLMQLFSEQELQVVDGLDLEPPEHEVLQIDPGDIQASADVLRSYVYANFQVAHLPVVSVYTWVVTMGRPVESAARVCILQQRGSFTRVFSREWEDRHEGAVLSLSMSRPMMEPLTLRVQPIDLVAIPSGALDAGFRAYLLDLIGNFLPRRVAVACERSVTFNALRERLGMAEICLQPSTRCFLVHRDDRGTRVWEGLDQVQEPHGTAFHFVVEIMNECDDKKVAISGEIPAAGGQPGDNTATPWDFNSDQMVLMQRGVSSHSSRIDSRSASWGSQSSRTPEASQASGSGEAGTIESYPSTLRSRGPIDASSGEQLVNLEFEYNGVFNWVLTWGAVRRHVASYYLGGVEPHTEDVLVHIIQLHEGITTQGGYLCPSWILDVDQPVCTFIEWVEDHTFHFDPQVARAFPMIGELLQDTPVILVVDDLPIRRAVILVEVNFPDGHEIYICEPYRFERVSTILDWLDGFVEVPALTEQFYNGQRVVRWQTIETHPGGLFQVRVIPEDELANPLPATRTPNGSLEMQPHDTWSSILSLQEQGEQQGRVGNDPVPVSWPDEADETEEHTLMNLDVSTQVSFRRSEPSFFSVVDRQKVLSYLRGWFQGSGMVTIWVHSLPDNVVQEYPSVCEFDRVEASFAQCAESWVMVHAARLTFVPIDPPPIFLQLPRPHILVVGGLTDTDCPFLCQVFAQGRSNLVSVVLPEPFPPTDVATLFAVAVPQHDCAYAALCYARYRAIRYMFRHDIELHRGAFVQLYELTDDIDSDITECEDGNDIYTTDESDSGDEESLEGRFDFAVGFWQEGIQVVPITAEERQVDDLSYYEQDFREYQLWRERVRVALAYTQTFNLHQLLEEARAYHEARGVWPGLVACVVPNDWHKGTPGDAWLLDYESLVVYLREVLLDGFPVDQKVGLYAVKPFVTPLEQLGEDALYILVLLDPLEGERAILIVEDHWQSDHLQLWPIGVGELTDTWQVIEEAHRTIDYETTCILEYEMQELPRMVQWRTLPGMKLHLTISRDGGECELPLALDNDEVEMMQTTQHEPVYERQRVHLQRLGVDPVYFQVTRYLDARLLQIPQGGIAQIWLLPGVGITSHDASVMLDLRVEIPSWGNWVRESWRDEPPEGRFLMIRGPLPAIRASKIDFHLIGASSSDLANGLRTLYHRSDNVSCQPSLPQLSDRQ